MNTRSTKRSTRARLTSVGVLSLLASLMLSLGSATPSWAVGERIYASGNGAAHVEILSRGQFVEYTHQIYLVSPQQIYIGSSTEVGKVVQLGQYPAGTELVFAIYVNNTGDTWYTGPGYRNDDGYAHANVSAINSEQVVVNFEDLWELGDYSFTDVVFRVKR
jgi:hypothetical protein